MTTAPEPDPNAWALSPREVGAILSVHPDTVKLWTEKGLIPCFRLPTGARRYRRADVDAILEMGRQS